METNFVKFEDVKEKSLSRSKSCMLSQVKLGIVRVPSATVKPTDRNAMKTSIKL